MTLQWKQGSPSGQTARDILASGDGMPLADESVRTIQVSDPGGYAVVTWEGKDGVWETWAWGDNGWSFVAEFPTATKAKSKAQTLSGSEETDSEKLAASAQKTVDSAQETQDLISDDDSVKARLSVDVPSATQASAPPTPKAAPSAEPGAEAAPARTPPQPEEALAAATLVSDVGDPTQLNQQDALGRETVHGRSAKVEQPTSDEAPPAKHWRGDLYGNPPIRIPKKQRKRFAAVSAALDKTTIPQIQPSQGG